MSNLNIYKSKSSTDLSSTETTPLEDGAVYFTNDTHEIYADLNGAREAYGSGGGGSALDKQQIEKNKQDILAKVSSNGGDVSDTVINTIEEETTQKFPIISPKDTIKKAIGKLKKWQTDMVADMGNYVLKSMIANQQINDQNKVPSSALAYTMNQQISKLNEEVISCSIYMRPIMVIDKNLGTVIRENKLLETNKVSFLNCNRSTNNPLGNGWLILMYSTQFWVNHPAFIHIIDNTITTGTLNCENLNALVKD